MWDHEGEEDHDDLVTSSLFEAAEGKDNKAGGGTTITTAVVLYL